MKTEHPIRSLCEALEVSASGYYDWSKRQTQPSPRAQENARLARQIVQIHRDSRYTYGDVIAVVAGAGEGERRSERAPAGYTSSEMAWHASRATPDR